MARLAAIFTLLTAAPSATALIPPQEGATDAPQEDPAAAILGPLPEDLGEALSRALQGNPQLRLAQSSVEQASARLNDLRLQTAQEAIALFHEIQQTETAVENARKHRDRALTRYENGAGTSSDMLDAEAALAEAEITRATSLARARALLGREPASLDGASGQELVALLGDLPASLEEMLEESLQGCAAIEVAEAHVDLAQAELRAQRLQVVELVTRHFRELQLRRNQVEYLRQRVAQIEAMIEAGIAPSWETTEARLERVKASIALARTEAALRYQLGLGASPRRAR